MQKKTIPLWLWAVSIVLLIISLIAIGVILLNRQKARLDFAQMAAAVQEIRETITQPTEPIETTVPLESTEATQMEATEEPTEETEAATESASPLVQYQKLQEEKPDMAGWLYIEDTGIDYPVMHTPKEPEKYLHKNFQGEKSYTGVPFINYRCKEDSDNLVIYGHNMADGTMFHTLVDYDKKEHWQTHPMIHFDSVEEEREYELLAAFYDRIYYTHEINFKFYNFIDATNEAEYNSAVKKFKEKSTYDTGVTPEYGQ